ncbi:hypothetical protein CEE37_06520 [candidate division LCP-89 bacterium B3_LCP]|uniref:Aromatic hydrocarbon degradation protein n=1 Tax=candidate division LCP-89 bacterium B3_LCP TaxID=2012998 RepID=A0A532V072_UNCL8|nr:MAG: hypothetical protein CEE37_06520 [candidate division LCP-89 bacterium B3_LCP]
MMRIKAVIIFPLILFAVILLRTAPVLATGSIFSGLGYGVMENFTSSRAIGMGNVGIVLNDSISLNALNPAALAQIRQARVSMGGYISRQTMRDQYAQDIEDWWQVEYFSIAVMLKKGLAIGFFLSPYSRVQFRYGWNGEINGIPYYQSYQGNGGLSRAAFQFAVSLGRWGDIGVSPSLIWGQVEELRGSYFDESGYDDIEFLTSKKWLAFSGTAGLLLHPFHGLTIGAGFEPEVPISLNETFVYSTDDSSVVFQDEYRLAAKYYAGVSMALSSKWLLAGQMMYSPWSEINYLPEGASGYGDATSLAGGAEWTPGSWNDDFFFKRFNYRFGFRWETSYAESQGSAIDGYFASIGFGYPFGEGQQRFDLSLEYGSRGDLSANGGQENIFKIRAGLNLGGTWFVRPKPVWED